VIEVEYEWKAVCVKDGFRVLSGTAFNLKSAEKECKREIKDFAKEYLCRYEITRVTREVLQRG